MKSIQYFTIALTALLFLTGCEDVIELDLDSSEPRTIIEANLNATTQVASVILSKSNNFYDSSDPETISGASIQLTSNLGTTYSLLETESGVYIANDVDLAGTENYTLAIDAQGEFYEASAQVPAPVSLDSIIVSSGGGGPFGGDGSQMLLAQFEDTPDIKNYYRIKAYQNDTLLAGTYTIIDDEFRGDGEVTSVGVREFFEEGNTIRLELLSTSKSYYDYFFQLSSQSGDGGNSTTPYNPVGNFSNDGIGYFGIFYSSALSVEL